MSATAARPPAPTTSTTSDPGTRTTVAVVGTGRIAEEHLAALRRSADVRLVGVCDLDPRLSARAAALHGAASYTDVTELLASERPAAVHLTTPPHTHVPLAEQAVDAGVRLVVVEKPAALDAGSLRDLLGHAAAAGATVVEDHSYRFNAPLRRLAPVLAAGSLGTVRAVEVRMAVPLGTTRYEQPVDRRQAEAMPGGVLHEFLPHLAYLTTWLLPPVTGVEARWAARDPTTSISPDSLDVDVVCADGATGSVRFASAVAPSTTTVTVRGTLGWASADLQLGSLRVSRPRGAGGQLDPLVDLAAGGAGMLADVGRALVGKLTGSPIYEGIGAFVGATHAAWRRGGPMPVADVDALAAADLVDAIVAARP